MNTSITIEQLKCFIAVSKEMNFRKAAKNLNMSQPPVTRHIANLEHNLKTKLYDRNSRSVKLTKDGTLFLTRKMPHSINGRSCLATVGTKKKMLIVKKIRRLRRNGN